MLALSFSFSPYMIGHVCAIPLSPRCTHEQEHLHREMLSPVEQMRAKFKKRRKEAGAREDSTMEKLAKFTSTMRKTKKRVDGEDKEEEKVPCNVYLRHLQPSSIEKAIAKNTPVAATIDQNVAEVWLFHDATLPDTSFFRAVWCELLVECCSHCSQARGEMALRTQV